MLIPELGVSALDAPGQPFYDPEADEALFSELELRLQRSTRKQIIRLPHHINDPEFADALIQHFERLVMDAPRSTGAQSVNKPST